MLPAEALRARRDAVIAPRALVAGALALALLAGCGDSDDEPVGPGGTPYELEVTLDPDGRGGAEPMEATASCSGGPACDELSALSAADLAPVDPGTPCTEIYGGPDEVEVEGVLDGEQVSATLTRANGCEIDRFEELMPLLRELFPDYRPGASLRP